MDDVSAQPLSTLVYLDTFYQGDKCAVAHQHPARLDLASADIKAGLFEQFASYSVSKIEHAAMVDIVEVWHAARKNPLSAGRLHVQRSSCVPRICPCCGGF